MPLMAGEYLLILRPFLFCYRYQDGGFVYDAEEGDYGEVYLHTDPSTPSWGYYPSEKETLLPETLKRTGKNSNTREDSALTLRVSSGGPPLKIFTYAEKTEYLFYRIIIE
jgi:hypothetical protein